MLCPLPWHGFGGGFGWWWNLPYGPSGCEGRSASLRCRGSTLLRPPTPHGLTAPQPNPGPKPGNRSEGEPRRGSRGSPSPIGGHHHRSPRCTSTRIATRLTDRPHHRPGDVDLAHPYRRRWWLPIIGPSATVLLDHLTDTATDDWQVHDATELAIRLGLGTRHRTPLPTDPHLSTGSSRFGFGHFDIEPGDPDADPCLTLWTTIGLVPERSTRRWPDPMRRAHASDLEALHQPAA